MCGKDGKLGRCHVLNCGVVTRKGVWYLLPPKDSRSGAQELLHRRQKGNLPNEKWQDCRAGQKRGQDSPEHRCRRAARTTAQGPLPRHTTKPSHRQHPALSRGDPTPAVGTVSPTPPPEGCSHSQREVHVHSGHRWGASLVSIREVSPAVLTCDTLSSRASDAINSETPP